MITDIEEYFTKGCGRCARFATPDCSTRKWAGGLADLRRICRDAGLSETIKWGHPCYMHAGRNIAIIGAFRDDFRLSFFNAGLMADPDGVLEKQGPATQYADTVRFSNSAQVAQLQPVIHAYLAEAIRYAAAGVTPPKKSRALDLPPELVDAMASDPDLADAFKCLTLGRQRSYVINLNAAKTTATRLSRIAKFRDRILAGKGATER